MTTDTTTSWFLIPLVAGFFALLGAVVGAVVAYWANNRIKIRELKHQDRRQWDSEILRCYVEVDRIAALHYAAAWRNAFDNEVKDGKVYEALAALAEELHALEVRLDLIGTADLAGATHALVEQCGGVLSLAHDRMAPPKEMRRSLSAARTKFRRAVRSELRINDTTTA